MLDHDKEIEIWIEPKPNEPTDQAYVPTIGHAIALALRFERSEAREGSHRNGARAPRGTRSRRMRWRSPWRTTSLASVHLNDQNGLKYDQDKNFGASNLRVAFNQVRVLEEAGYGSNGEFIGLDVKAMRTQKGKAVTAHLDQQPRDLPASRGQGALMGPEAGTTVH